MKEGFNTQLGVGMCFLKGICGKLTGGIHTNAGLNLGLEGIIKF